MYFKIVSSAGRLLTVKLSPAQGCCCINLKVRWLLIGPVGGVAVQGGNIKAAILNLRLPAHAQLMAAIHCLYIAAILVTVIPFSFVIAVRHIFLLSLRFFSHGC